MTTTPLPTPEKSPAWLHRLPLKLIYAAADKQSVNRDLLTALVMTESSGNHLATRFEAGWVYFVKVAENAKSVGIPVHLEKKFQATSWGLCQVMGSVAREMGFNEHLKQLLIPRVGLEFGAKKLARCLTNYKGSYHDALAAYNGGSARRDEFGELEPMLDEYVKKVMGFFDQLAKPV